MNPSTDDRRGALDRSASRFAAPIGTRDLQSPETDRRRAFNARFAEMMGRAAYHEIETPMFEELGLFLRVGESTDVVTKEMYDFEDKGGRRMALRPELTAGVCRAFVQHKPTASPWKVWYSGPQFRYEAPQKGRYRQFSQVGVEAIGVEDPDLDVEVIALAADFFHVLGLRQVTLHLNTLGEVTERQAYTDALGEYLNTRRAELSERSIATLERNPLRVLDSKRPEDHAVLADAPTIQEFLSDRSRRYFDAVCAGLESLGIGFEISPRLVRGLDYYCHTTFEFAADSLSAAQNAVGGGGRYDGLVESLGGPPTPGVGFALGIDRTLLACDAEDVFVALPTPGDVFVVDLAGGQAAALCTELRRAGIAVDRTYSAEFGPEGSSPRSMKAQMRAANRAGSRLALIVGPDEVTAGVATLRDLSGGEQTTVSRADLIASVRAALGHTA